MRKLLKEIEKLKISDTGDLINKRISQFERLGKKNEDELFKELCFCLLTANTDAVNSIRIQKEIDDGFLKLNKTQLSRRLKELKYRFYNKRADYIIDARQHHGQLKRLISDDASSARNWLVQNVKGLGLKESSHFLRNIGVKDLAIVDFHIVDLLQKHGIAEKPRTLSRANYLTIEEKLKKIGAKTGLDMARLDLYLWYIETGKVLK